MLLLVIALTWLSFAVVVAFALGRATRIADAQADAALTVPVAWSLPEAADDLSLRHAG